MEYFDGPAIREIVRQAEENGAYPVASLIVGVVKSDAFRMKEATPVAAQAGN
jgi:hypothetical protein